MSYTLMNSLWHFFMLNDSMLISLEIASDSTARSSIYLKAQRTNYNANTNGIPVFITCRPLEV